MNVTKFLEQWSEMTVYGATCGKEDTDVTTDSALKVECFVSNINFPNPDPPIEDDTGKIEW